MEEGKMSFRTKLLLGGIGGSFGLIFIFIVVIIATFYILGIIDVEGLGSTITGGGPSYSSIGSSSEFWWPIGSDDTQTEDGVTYASGNPPASIITSGVGPRWGKNHGGIDVSGDFSIPGPNIIASQAGTVEYASENGGPYETGYYGSSDGGGYGNHVIIDHGNGYATVYAHLYKGSITVKTGDTVRQGQLIGRMGSSGSSTGVHLHFEVRQNGTRQDPENYVSADNPRPTNKTSNGAFVSGNDNTETICLTLKENNYSDEAVGAIMGNIQAESSFLTVNTNELGCDGLVQWCFDRLNNLKNTYGNGWSQIDNQLEYLLYELNQSYTDTNNYLHENHSAEDMAYYYCMHFEIPGESICASGVRQGYASSLYEYAKKGCQ